MCAQRGDLLEQQLLKMVKQYGKVSTTDAIERLSVSGSTVRRLFIKLEEQGGVIRQHGGICQKDGGEYSFTLLDGQNSQAKEKIAQMAIKLLPKNGMIYLDGGTTVARFAAALAEEEHEGITVFTNSLANLTLLADNFRVHLIGGEYRENRKDFCGFIAQEAIKLLHFSACFLGCDAINAKDGFTTTDFDTARINSLVMEASKEKYVLADLTKFGTSSFVQYAKCSDISAIITDYIPQEPEKTALYKAGIKLINSEI